MLDRFKALPIKLQIAVGILAVAAVLNAVNYDSAYTGLMTVKFAFGTAGLLAAASLIVTRNPLAVPVTMVVAVAMAVGYISNETIWEIEHGLDIGFESFSVDRDGISGFAVNLVYPIAAVLVFLEAAWLRGGAGPRSV